MPRPRLTISTEFLEAPAKQNYGAGAKNPNLLGVDTAGPASPGSPRSPFCTDFSPGSRHVLPLRYSIWLCFSSLTFLVPAFIACWFTDPIPWILVVTHVITSLISLNYWRKCQAGPRRNLDLIFSKVSFVVTLGYGAMHVNGAFLHAVGWPLAALIPFLFWLGIFLEQKERVWWIAAHAAMHVAVSVGMSLVVVGSDEHLNKYINEHPWFIFGV